MTKTRMIDEGTISPKVAIPTSVLVLAGAVLFILDSLGVFDIDDTLWVTLFGAGGFAGAAGYKARPGAVVKDETGLALLEALVLLTLVGLAVLAFIVLT